MITCVGDPVKMEPNKKKPLYLLALGALIMSAPFILQQFMVLDDGANGLIRGVGIGLMVVSLIFSAKQRRLARNAGQ